MADMSIRAIELEDIADMSISAIIALPEERQRALYEEALELEELARHCQDHLFAAIYLRHALNGLLGKEAADGLLQKEAE